MKILFFLLFIFQSAFALETDNFLSWKMELKDSSQMINRFLREEIQRGLIKVNAKPNLNCDEATKVISQGFKSFLVHDNPVEKWLMENLTPEEIYPQTLFYVEESIYRDPYLFYIPKFGLAPNIQVNGIYFGTDKLSHFASTGMNYFRIFKQTGSLEKALTYGILDELSLHGFAASGVYSYADLEANYQGFLFYRNFCEGKRPFLKMNQGLWELTHFPDIKNFVSPAWDETFNPSFYVKSNRKKVYPILKENYCGLLGSTKVQNRFKQYSLKVSESESMKHLRELQASGSNLTPRPQHLSEICGESHAP